MPDTISLKIFSPLMQGRGNIYGTGTGRIFVKQFGIVVVAMPEAVFDALEYPGHKKADVA